MLTQQQKALLDKLAKVDDITGIIRNLSTQTAKQLEQINEVDAAIKKLIAEKTQGFPWLADAISQYYEFRDLKIAEFLETKLRPGLTSAARVKELAKEKREMQKKFIVTRNFIRYYEALFPWLSEFVGEDVDELLVQATQEAKAEEDQTDPARTFLSQGEYEKLSTAERNQRALDRYWVSRKSPWKIGRDYERYIGHLYEQKGFAVYYQGIVEGLEDLGRDLICKKDSQVEIVQCKNWRKEKTIHEKHINQLFGTTVTYFIQNSGPPLKRQLDIFPELVRKKEITAALYTSAHCSETAREFARVLGIMLVESFPLQKYPCIKCNVSHRTGERIYHLPFDQQYDRTLIDEERSERYVETVLQAERLGFRRAWRWRGDKETSEPAAG